MRRLKLTLVLLFCFGHWAEAQVDFSMLENAYPGEDQGWLTTLYAPYQSETVQWEFPFSPSETDMIGSRVIIQSGPLTIIFDAEKGETCLIGRKETATHRKD